MGQLMCSWVVVGWLFFVFFYYLFFIFGNCLLANAYTVLVFIEFLVVVTEYM